MAKQLEYTSDQTYERLLSDIKQCEFSQTEVKGLLFFIGFSIRRITERFGFNDITVSDILSSLKCKDIESAKSKLHDSDTVRSALYTTVKVIYNNLANSAPLESNMNVGRGRLFEETIVPELWKKYALKEHSFKNGIGLYRDLFMVLGNEMDEHGISNPKKLISEGYTLYISATLDDPQSVAYVIDLLYVNFPSTYRAIFYIPIMGNVNPEILKHDSLFTCILRHTEKSLKDDQVRNEIHNWHQQVFYSNSDNWNEDWKFDNKKHFETIADIVYHGSLFNKQISDDIKEKIKALSILDPIGFEGSNISLKDYRDAVCNIFCRDMEYDLEKKNWNSRGEYLFIMSMLFIYSCIYSIVPASIELKRYDSKLV